MHTGSSYESFYFNSNGNINWKVLNVVKKKELTFQIKVCSTLDDKPENFVSIYIWKK